MISPSLDLLARYRAALESMPPSGSGLLHRRLLGVANLARIAGIEPECAAADLGKHARGPRIVRFREIYDAVEKAYAKSSAVTSRDAAPVVDGRNALEAILRRGAGCAEVELAELSPVLIDWPVERDAVEILARLYRPDEDLFIGNRYDSSAEQVLRVSEWLARFGHGDYIPEFIIPNPLTGLPGHTKVGTLSYRADACVREYRFAVVEFDNLPRAQQAEFWAGVALPVVALIDSGGKSIHGWVRIDASDAGEWERRVEVRLFSLLRDLGADAACRNESRLSRMPGHLRMGTGRIQRLLYLNPEGGQLIS